MKQLLTLCLVLALAGCANKAKPRRPEPPQPVNGQCSIVQDMCLLGTPSGTGDTTPPYGWMCLGSHGGTDAPCSVPTARIEEDEAFAGQNRLEEKVKAGGALRGQLTILDFDEPGYSHSDLMLDVARDMGIPEENLHLAEYRSLKRAIANKPAIREKTLVFGAPTGWATDVSDWDVNFLRQHNYLAVVAAGNTDTDNRNLWFRTHAVWEGDKWKNAFAAFGTGKFIIAKHADADSAGNIVAYEGNVKCGQAKEYCYSLMLNRSHSGSGTSSASVRLGALTFYLFQLWDTPQEVVGVLNTCAEDIGEPGIDEEFGRGIVSVVCDTVQHRERRAVTSSLQVSHSATPVMSQMTVTHDSRHLVPHSPQSLSAPVSLEWFKLFYTVRGHDLETVTGHLGGRFSLRGTELFISGGSDHTPLGVYSPLRPAVRTPFLELGTRRTLFSRRGHTVSLLGAYGHSKGNGLSAHVGHLGTRYGRRFSLGTLSLQALYRRAQGRLGILGYHEAGASPVPFTDNTPEVRVSFILTRWGT